PASGHVETPLVGIPFSTADRPVQTPEGPAESTVASLPRAIHAQGGVRTAANPRRYCELQHAASSQRPFTHPRAARFLAVDAGRRRRRRGRERGRGLVARLLRARCDEDGAV